MSGRGLNRTEILRRECTGCRGNGYRVINGVEQTCETCEGRGEEHKEVPYKFDGRRSPEEIEEAWNS